MDHVGLPCLLGFSTDIITYVNPTKIGIVVVLLVFWALAAQWIDRDTDIVKTKREQWNLIVMSGGLVGFLVLFVGPWTGVLFVAGIAAWLALAGGAMLWYVIHRNGRVIPAARVLTIDHFKRTIKRDAGKKKSKSEKGLRVHISNHKGDFVEPPDDPEESKTFDAVQDFLFDLLWRRASNAELVATKESHRLVYRVDGVVTEKQGGLPNEDAERIIRFLKQTAGLNVEEIRRPQKGTIKAALLDQEGDVGPTEIQTSGSTAGERLRLKIQASPKVLRLPELGLAKPRLEAVQTHVIDKPTGLVIVSAPKEHGITTSQYAILKCHDAYMHNIHAIERRPAADLDNITQQVYEGANADVDYARLLQTTLRREPDIVMVGECEDRETAQIASRAAADDRKLYLGMQAKDAFDALTNYLAFVDDNKLASSALLAIINQRLVRKLCTECREAFKPDVATLKKLNLPADKIECFYRTPTEPKLDRKGREIICTNCRGTGYLGRTGVYEVLIVDEPTTKLIAAGEPINRIKAQCRKNKMYYLQEEGLLKVIDGTTSMQEVLRCLRTGDTK